MAQRPLSSPRATRTRAALIAAGFDLVAERPIDAIPIDDVVAKAAVAKGSFFNHFIDKQDFANAIAKEVRLEVEALVSAHNAAITDPIERIAGGMKVAVDFALTQPSRAIALLRSQGASTAHTHPLNQGLRSDIEAALAQNMLQPAARTAGVLYWLGLCQAIMIHIIDDQPGRDAAHRQLVDLLRLGLTGLGASSKMVDQVIESVRQR